MKEERRESSCKGTVSTADPRKTSVVAAESVRGKGQDGHVGRGLVRSQTLRSRVCSSAESTEKPLACEERAGHVSMRI